MTCKQAGLSFAEIDEMTIGMALDFVDTYIEWNKPKNQQQQDSVRRATQKDFDAF